MTSFSGFPPETFDFLRALTDDNTKAWFDRHRSDYQAWYITPAKLFVEAMGERLCAFDPAISAIPQVNKSIFRINNDLRFSKDSPPYKNHIDLWFYVGDDRRSVSGFFFRLTSDRVLLGTGAHRFEKDNLKAFRDAVICPASAVSLTGIMKRLEADGYALGELQYKTTPRGYGDHGDNELLKYGSLHASLEIDVDHLSELVHRTEFVDWCAERYAPLGPLHRWLMDHAVAAS